METGHKGTSSKRSIRGDARVCAIRLCGTLRTAMGICEMRQAITIDDIATYGYIDRRSGYRDDKPSIKAGSARRLLAEAARVLEPMKSAKLNPSLTNEQVTEILRAGIASIADDMS